MWQLVTRLAAHLLPVLPRPLRQLSRAVAWSAGDAAGQHGVPTCYQRMKVCGHLDIPKFIFSGERDARTLVAALERVGSSPCRCSTVLDFGCGVARILARFSEHLPHAQLHGTDVDADAIAWCRNNLASVASFTVSRPTPPLSYADGQFDLVYSWAVFTHLDEEYQFRWLEELHRVTKPGAILLLTVFGPSQMPGDAAAIRGEFAARGFCSVRRKKWKEFYPPFYRSSLHSKDYIQTHWSRFFTIVDHLEGAGGNQDLVILRRT
jgi:SAM-dependent methyltransferase